MEKIKSENKEEARLWLCPFYGAGLCEENSGLCFSQYEECDRTNKLMILKLDIYKLKE